MSIAIDACKRAKFFELSSRIQSLLSPIAAHRKLWQFLKNYYTTGVFSWQIISNLTTSNDRNLGNYYRIQFYDGKCKHNYIYRETNFSNLWQVSKRLQKSSEFYAKGLNVVVVNEGEEINIDKTEPGNYYIHVRSVAPYFEPNEIKKRITVFEQNHNISKFYYDIPFSKDSQSSIRNCWLNRTIYTIPYPMPYIIKRVEIPSENIKKETYTPIQYSNYNIRKQIYALEEAISRKDCICLQPLLQGSLLVQVNEGPKRIAEIFLSDEEENEDKQELRNTFRLFLKVNSIAVKMHSNYVIKNPIYAVLQEELESALNRITSALQPYLKK